MTKAQQLRLAWHRYRIGNLIAAGRLEDAGYACMEYRQDAVRGLCSNE